MAHPTADLLRFTRSEWVRGLRGVSEDDAARHFGQMNSIGWMVGHLANQEHRYWVVWAQQRNVAPGLDERVGSGKPASTPPLGEMWAAWQTVTAAADAYLDALTPALLETHLKRDGAPVAQSVGTLLLRNLYHYWFHTGEAAAVRQMLGHPNLPDFVGDMSAVPYRPER